MPTKTMTREAFAQLMAKTAHGMLPTKRRKPNSPENFDDFDYDKKSNAWMKAAEILTSVGRPFATCIVDDDELEDGYKIIPLRSLRDIPAEVADIIREASDEMQVRFGKVAV